MANEKISAMSAAAALDGTEVYPGVQAGANVKIPVIAGVTDPTLKNVFVGIGAGFDNTTGYNNVFIGGAAGVANTTGYQNTFVGARAGENSADALGGAFFGYKAGFLNTGNYNTFIGSFAGRNNDTGAHNVFVGSTSGQLNTTGSKNVFTGYESGRANTTGYSNVFVGYKAGSLNTEGNLNIVIGDTLDPPTPTTNSYLNIGNAIKGDMSAGPIEIVPLLKIATHTPSGPSDTGVAGTIAWDGTHLWVCIDTDTWKSAPLA